MRKEQVTCDVCGAQKQETNHWFVLLRWEDDPTGFTVDVESARLDPTYDSAFITDLCGEACVLKKVSELISKQ
jgi:hypothetical protein